MLTSSQIRRQFIEFFQEREHQFVPSSPVVPLDDPTLLFANAGMNQFKDVFLGTGRRSYSRSVNSQKCIRVSGKHNDLEQVGRDTYHHTFFEMLGNWSFGDYFKREAIQWAWELLTEVWGLDQDRLWATVFGGDDALALPSDEEAEALWAEISQLPEDRIMRFGRKDNFWEMGEIGPCGPCSEIHLDQGPEYCDRKDEPGHVCAVNTGCARYIELWNLVFIQLNRDEQGKLSPLPSKHVDTGMGLERITAVLQDKKSNYETDLFTPLLDATAKLTGSTYTGKLDDERDAAFRVVADHLRAVSFAITDGALPSNEGRGYVVRRILRRAARFGRLLGMHDPFIYQLVPTLIEGLGEAFPELPQRADHVANVIEAEEKSFGRTLDRGIERFDDAAQRVRRTGGKRFPGDEAFLLYDTYGFPIDLTQLMAAERNLTIDMGEFERLMTAQRQRARAAGKTAATATGKPGLDYFEDKGFKCDFVGYEHTRVPDAKILALWDNQWNQLDQADTGQEVQTLLDRTPFYGESGGQVGDQGSLRTGQVNIEITGTEKIGDFIIHRGKVDSGRVRVGDSLAAEVAPARFDTMRNHTATHLLHEALRHVLGKHIQQAGSSVGPDLLRFDFTHFEKVKPDQIRQVEARVNETVLANLSISTRQTSLAEAQKVGAAALFGEKYGEVVRLVEIGEVSRELCGGTHCSATGQIGLFKILSEESVAAGVRRITAVTGRGALQYVAAMQQSLNLIGRQLKVPPQDTPSRVAALQQELRELRKQIEKGTAQDIAGLIDTLIEKSPSVGEAKIIVGQLSDASIEQLRSQTDRIKKKCPSSAILLASSAQVGSLVLLAAMTDDLIKRGLSAGALIKEIAPLVDGRGGGKPHLAQAGGQSPQKIPQALEKAKTRLNEMLM